MQVKTVRFIMGKLDNDINRVKYFFFDNANRIYPDSATQTMIDYDNECVYCIDREGEGRFFSFDALQGIVEEVENDYRPRIIIDLRAYREALRQARPEGYYTPDSWDEYQTVVKDNFIDLRNHDVYYLSQVLTQDDVNEKTKKILEAYKKLKLR